MNDMEKELQERKQSETEFEKTQRMAREHADAAERAAAAWPGAPSLPSWPKWLKWPKISLTRAWFDLWIGAYWDHEKRRLYLLPIPCCGICLDFS